MAEEITLDIKKSVQENASHYYERAKELRRKAKSAEEAIRKTEKEMAAERKKEAPIKKVRVKRDKQWYEKFHWFMSGGFLVLAGRDSKQNEILVSRYFDDNDLFFHADIKGAPATILKGGKQADGNVLEETAQFAASYSSAWKQGLNTVDVYAVERPQVSKEAQGEYLGQGSFVISGKRTWFKNVPLGLDLSVDEKGLLVCRPAVAGQASSYRIVPGDVEKGKAAAAIAKTLGVSVDEVLSALPSGTFSYEKV